MQSVAWAEVASDLWKDLKQGGGFDGPLKFGTNISPPREIVELTLNKFFFSHLTLFSLLPVFFSELDEHFLRAIGAHRIAS